MKFFMRKAYTKEWVQVHENDWKGEDVYINDLFHSAGCWGDCYREEDFLHLKK